MRAALLLLLILAPCARAEEDRRRVPMVVHHGAPFIQLTLGGARGLFLFDTGANTSGVDRGWLARSRARYQAGGRTVIGGTTGNLQVGRATFARLDLGNGFFLSPSFTVQSYGHFLPPSAGRQAGLLGSDFINRYQVTFDYRKRKLLLALKGERPAPPASFSVVPLVYPLRLPTTTVRLAGKSFPCRLDTGATYTDAAPYLDVNQAAVDELARAGVVLRQVKSITVAGVSGRLVLPVLAPVRPRTLEIGPARIPAVQLVLHRSGTLAVATPLALASGTLLARLERFVIDPFESKLWVGR